MSGLKPQNASRLRTRKSGSVEWFGLLTIVAICLLMVVGQTEPAISSPAVAGSMRTSGVSDVATNLKPIFVARRVRRGRLRVRSKKVFRQHRKVRRDRTPDHSPEANRPQENGPKQTKHTGRDHQPRHRKERKIVCISGRIRAGDCLCRIRNSRRRLDEGVFACGRIFIPAVTRDGSRLSVGAGNTESGAQTGSTAPQSPLEGPVSNSEIFAAHEVLVTLRSGTALDADQQIAQTYGLVIIGGWRIELIGVRLRQVPNTRWQDCC